MGNTACCQGQTGDLTAGEVTEAANRPQRKDMAGLSAELERGETINGVGIKEAILVQAALRGYLARQMIKKLSFVPSHANIVEHNYQSIPDFSNELTRKARKILGGGDYIIPDGHWDNQLFDYTPVQFNDNSVYVGEWTKEGAREGRGILYTENGDTYECQWRNDQPNGDGRAILANGDVYFGQFKNEKFHGQGKYSSLDGYSYDGSWVKGEKHGHGRELQSDGSVYEGEFVKGAKEGEGNFSWPDGRTYKGSWRKGMKEGFGVLTFEDGKRQEGNWSDGKLHGEGNVFDGVKERRAEWDHGRRVRWL